MKKSFVFVFVAILALITIPAEAQLKFGVKGGLNISRISFNESIVDEGNVTGFNIGPMAEFQLPIVGVGMDAAILYSQKGVKSGDKSLRTDYIDVPVNLKWKIGIPIAKVFFTAGPYASFRVAGDKVWNIPGKIGQDLSAKSFGAGLNFGAGVEVFSHLQVGANYGLGLTNNYSSDGIDLKGKDRGWSITAAILF